MERRGDLGRIKKKNDMGLLPEMVTGNPKAETAQRVGEGILTVPSHSGKKPTWKLRGGENSEKFSRFGEGSPFKGKNTNCSRRYGSAESKATGNKQGGGG